MPRARSLTREPARYGASRKGNAVKPINLIMVLAALLLAAGCANDSRRSESLGNEVALRGDSEQHGQLIYMQNCYSCHLGGEGGIGPAINNKPLPGFLMKAQIRAGIGEMPA